MTIPRPVPVLPAQGRRVAFIGKGGAGKSTLLAYLLAHWTSYGVPTVAIDTDTPGDKEHGTLYAHANAVDLGAPVHPAPAVRHIRREARRLCPEKGVCLLDTGAWQRSENGRHLAVVSAVDKVILCLQPTPNEVERARSVLGHLQKLQNTGMPVPELHIVLTMVGRSVAADDLEGKLQARGHSVLRSRFLFSSAMNGPAHIFKRPIKPRTGTTTDDLAREILNIVAR
ncbi:MULTISPECIES: hypothetical protein [unclassified Streptomyces]|uniref:hypothetical protein n=1 Tax=unclassified Streptomyces TaxID=2593676 RepID=UPI002270516B|nr:MULTISPECIES: hypothetical protein [unclassified Streptomyces]MCY0924227.1 hypothetical protein [Streptomyces sp. H27-G5]MCY0963226.1 hypothetical protein [Streptomyces sp. H27-H5]